jgi:hypothetical protein
MLPSVPMQLPIEGFTLEQYLHYLSWRIEVQMVATRLNEWRHGGDKAYILKAIEAASKRSEKFPAIEMPQDIIDPLTAGHLDLTAMLQELTGLFGSVQLTAGTAKEA